MAIAASLSLLYHGVQHTSLQSLAVFSILVPILYILINEFVRASARVKGLKGPCGLPLIGNLAQIRTNAAEQYRVWSKAYGPVYQIQLGNIPVIVVNSAAAAKVLFGQNAQALCSRPEFYTFHKLTVAIQIVSTTTGTTIGTSPYSESLKRRRKGAASALNRPSVESYVSHLDVESKAFVEELHRYGKGGEEPVDPMAMIQRLSLSLSLTLNWGVRVASQEEDLFTEITHVEEEISKFRSTTGNLQDYIPLLRLIPFSRHSKIAKEMRDRRDKYLLTLNRDLDERMEKGIHKPCIQANVILDKDARLSTEELASISLTMLSGGLDTITTLVAWSLGFLSQRPDIQAKAAQEIQMMYGQHQPLCDHVDDQKCTYVAALVRECLRYFTVLRLALPRTSIRDVTYNGTVIPSGTVFFLNAWACNMDPEVWSDPEDFRPERWFEQPDAPFFTYGMGYRMCAGSLLANRELYIIFMRTLSTFHIEPLCEADWHPLRSNLDPTSLVAIPRKYKVRFIPRDEKSLLRALVE
ncbi:cytochrome P450 phenylacetate hydroxylase [Aspergillus heteromorphus CBS 117.55]|uniref:Cytochrome P450 phenylacetate hydroxylase n=1 Tax=Aspergillus heteromorphus CBS 117.55 TaxID=1448321 RepID=A0A317UXI7_9EURO|nr:cytochrome P450 phenylacetate hydroxylase [Aspergillus heteromorphus CBS 117.55]PWY64710.1 cytochrome P450 phenylacetate hydroxylase [Aspergillus heteromorphus CBS 117.55]